jgi:hypothetical protein
MTFSPPDFAFVSKVYTIDVTTEGATLANAVPLFQPMFADYPMIRWAQSEVDILLWHSGYELVTEEGEEPNLEASTRPVRLLTKMDVVGQETPWLLQSSNTWENPLEIKDLPPVRNLVLAGDTLEGDQMGFSYKARVYMIAKLRRAAAG